MFDLEHHQKILHTLKSLNPSIFQETGTNFGGGTLIALLHGEYRWSKDVDFICPVGPGYRRLREIVFDNGHNPAAFFSNTDSLEFPRELTANQSGIRFLVISKGTPIKFEVVAESRIQLEEPEYPEWIDLPCLSSVDRYAEKLLANADRWRDVSIESRDLIDLAILRLKGEQSEVAIQKAEAAYPVIEPLKRAINRFQGEPVYRRKCFDTLFVQNRSKIIDGLDLLAADIGLSKTEREHDELHVR